MTFALSFIVPILMASPAPQPTFQSLCEAGEDQVFNGAVEDDLGLDVAVCLGGSTPTKRLTIRWVGEGGSDAVSCLSNQCDGVIEYSRYTSAHLTILRLGWFKNGSEQWLCQTFSRANIEGSPQILTTHSWRPEGALKEDIDSFPVRTHAAELSLMVLESVLEPTP